MSVVTFLFTDIEGRPGGGRPTRTRCGRHSRPTITPCVTRSKPMTARCSTTPATGCAPYSPLPVRLSSRSRRAASARVAGAHGHRDRRSGIARRRLLRHRPQSRGAGDGGRPWRPDPDRRRDGRSAQWRRPDFVGVEAVTRYRQAGRCLPGPSRRTAHRVPTVEDGRSDAGKPAATNHQFRRPRGGTRRAGDAS